MNDNPSSSRLGPIPVSILAAALVGVPLAAPSRAADDVSAARPVAGFVRIRLEGAFTTEIIAGARRTRVVVSGGRDRIDRVTTEVRDGTLIVGMRSGMEALGRPPKLEIALPALRGFTDNGAGSTKIVGLSGGDVDIASGGAGSIVAAGSAGHERISLDGAGKIDATAVAARDVTVENNGVGSVSVRAGRTLTMNLNGVGEIRYTGNPAHIESHVNGIGRIGRL